MNPARLLRHFDRISEAPDAIPRLRRFVLDLAVRGKLAAQDPSNEPACAFLRRMSHERMQPSKATPVARSAPVRAELTPDGALFALPDSWCWARLDSLVEFSA